ncbi:DUF4381 domain-containing protein [Glaciecola siphonariae]|uniref:DUF4381 domain-containing protein n=1 Tax=Glaciecola siphonariae TaxID=521012 RepID=A0ABV9LTK4_9ALTE
MSTLPPLSAFKWTQAQANNLNPNAASPLDQLADIHLPQAVSIWPPAVGYWIVLALLLGAFITLYLWNRTRKNRLKPRNESLKALESIKPSDTKAYAQIHHVLKQAAHAYLPQHKVLHLHGSGWQSVLTGLYTHGDQKQICATLQALAAWQYDERTELENFEQTRTAARTWIKRALPPKKGALDV